MKNGKGKKMLSQESKNRIKNAAREDAEIGNYSKSYYRCFPCDVDEAYWLYRNTYEAARRGNRFHDDRDYEDSKI